MSVMADPALDTVQLQDYLDRMRQGEPGASDELLRKVCGRLERLAHKMLRSFPKVQRWVEAEDVMQNALLRLLKSIDKIHPTSVRQFFGLAAEQMRRELIDLSRHYYGPRGLGTHHAGHLSEDGTHVAAADRGQDRGDSPGELDKWCAFHENVEKLPPEEREVVGLIFYHGWTHAQVAELFQVTVRTIQRRWQSALLKLHLMFHEDRDDAV